MASGVLILCLGQATKLASFLLSLSKTYLATVSLGVVTNTYDGEGQVIRTGDYSHINETGLVNTLKQFLGEIEQIPPMFSARCYQGRRLYHYARSGLEIERRPKKIRIKSISLIKWHAPDAVIRIECSSGTYIRSIAYDAGEMLGCGAFLKELVRENCGPFDLKDSIKFEDVPEIVNSNRLKDYLYPPDYTLSEWKSIVVGNEVYHAVVNGGFIEINNECVKVLHISEEVEGEIEEYCRAYSPDRRLVALLRRKKNSPVWQAFTVFPEGI